MSYMTLWFCMGTAGELIKVYPLLRWAESHHLNWVAIHTGQSGSNFWKQWDDFRMPRERSVRVINSDTDLQTSRQALKWFLSGVTLSEKVFHEKLFQSGHKLSVKNDFLFVHGDTLSTLLGATWSWRLGIKLVHVEAGLRSPSLFQPFPEEINRRMTSEIAHWHMVPDETAKMNLIKAGFEENIINTGGNTLIDAIREVLTESWNEEVSTKEKFCVANLHRHENLSSEKRWKQLIDVTLQSQKVAPVYFAMHAPTEKKLDENPQDKKKLVDAGVQLIPRMKFSKFIRLIDACEFVISDGGSNQEECFYLGKPCLILREATERVDGLGENAILSKFEPRVIKEFLKNPQVYKREPISHLSYPTQKIFSSLGL